MTKEQRAPLAAFFALTVLVMLVLAHGMTRPGVTSFLAEGGSESGQSLPTISVPLPPASDSGSANVVIVEAVDADGELSYRIDLGSAGPTADAPEASATRGPRIRVTTGSSDGAPTRPGTSWYLPNSGGSSGSGSPSSPATATGEGTKGSTPTDPTTVRSGDGQEVHTTGDEGGSGKGGNGGVIVPMLIPEDVDPFEPVDPVGGGSIPQLPEPVFVGEPQAEEGVLSPEAIEGEIDETAPAADLAP